MQGRPPRTREAWRRCAAGLVILLAAGVGLGDDLRGTMNPRRGARALLFDLPHLGSTTVQVPRTATSGVVLLLHRGGSTAELSAVSAGIPWHVLLVDVDVARLRGEASATCGQAAATLEDISRRAQRDAGVTAYQRPVIVATTAALSMATAAIAGSTASALPAAVAVGGIAGDRTTDCATADEGQQADTVAARWGFASSAHNLASPLDAALRTAAVEPHHGTTPVQRWLRHFDLPLTAAWSTRPRAMLVLLSSATGWRAPEEDVARRLAEDGVHVIGIDALRSFWQRRSPRDVALELQRLTDALASTGLPVYIGGRGFGAETMAVAGEMMTSSRTVAGIVLIDPGPTAFFEVEPPALALRPFGPSEWSTRAAIARLGRPTLCVAQDGGSPAALLCGSLGRAGKATFAQPAGTSGALAATVGRFVLRMPAATHQ